MQTNKNTKVSKAMKTGKPQQKRRPKNIKKDGQKKPVQQVIAPVVSNQNLKRNITVRADFDEKALNLSFASLYSYYAGKGCMAATDGDGQNPILFYYGMNYLFEALCSAIKSGTIEVSKAPEVVLDLFNALSSKNITFMTYSKLAFSWNLSPGWGSVSIPIGGSVWTPTVIVSDDGTYNSGALVPSYGSNDQSYSYFLAQAAGIVGTPKAALVDPAKYKSPLARDVSSFARSYVYNGLQPSAAGGYYKDVENEVGITAPMLSSFCLYENNFNVETRVPTKLHAYSGDAAFSVGAPLHPTFVSYFNKRSPSFKCIDFDWISGVLTQMMCLAIPKAASLGPGNWTPGDTIGCTYQDFRIMLRQALLNVFDSQYMVQFTGPMAFGNGENGFVPFQVNGHCYGSQLFSGMVIPSLIKENLNALKARSIRIKRPQGSKINVLTYYPVLGRYVADVPPEPQYNIEGTDYPLFQSTPQAIINLVDGSVAPGSYVNFNGTYYQTVLASWNFAINRVKAVLQSTTSIAGDQGPLGLGALFYTAVVADGGTNPTVKLQQAGRVLKSPYLDNIRNGYPTEKKLVKGDSKKNIAALPPASIISETQQFTTSGVPPPTEMQALLDTLIVPVIRLDPNGTSDQLSLQMYQVETKECVSSKYEVSVSYSGGAVWSRLSRLAEYCITGVGHDTSGEYAAIMEQLSAHNDAGMLSGLLGGLAKSILPPDVHGVVDTVADLLPF